MKYAIINSGGKQIKAFIGESIWVEKLPNNLDEEVIFESVNLIFDGKDSHYGQPTLKNSFVKGVVQKQGKSKKIIIFKTKAKSNWSTKKGHRQPYTRVLVSDIVLNKKSIEPKKDSTKKTKKESSEKND